MQRSIISAVLTLALCSCSSMFKGITEALIEKDAPANRMCEITGPEFDGIRASLNENKQTRILMVHGIGKHLPGYSARFREKLLKELHLYKMDPSIVTVKLTTAEADGDDAGALTVYRYLSDNNEKSLLFAELTWSEISNQDKEVIAFDDSDAYSFRRADINNSLKRFLNATVPDILIYNGNKHAVINVAIRQSLCWTLSEHWQTMSQPEQAYCNFYRNEMGQNIANSNLFVVTHSLGSRITMDTFNSFALSQQQCQSCTQLVELNQSLKNTTVTVFMLANQLPLLQVGQLKPPVTERIADYCSTRGERYSERLFGKLRIVAFNDPNDILSYPIPLEYASHFIDSRMCPEVVNVDVAIAREVDVFGVTDFANPLEAHSGYHEDQRVVKVISAGLSKKVPDPLLDEQCHWVETISLPK